MHKQTNKPTNQQTQQTQQTQQLTIDILNMLYNEEPYKIITSMSNNKQIKQRNKPTNHQTYTTANYTY